jgi:hypothetical protein
LVTFFFAPQKESNPAAQRTEALLRFSLAFVKNTHTTTAVEKRRA